MAIKFDYKSVELAKKLCELYINPQYLTFKNVCFAGSVRHLNLTPREVSNYIHFAIKMNIVDDEKANQIRNKAIKNAERKKGRSNRNAASFYDELFKERAEDKKNFPKGHGIYNESYFSQDISQGEQISLI